MEGPSGGRHRRTTTSAPRARLVEPQLDGAAELGHVPHVDARLQERLAAGGATTATTTTTTTTAKSWTARLLRYQDSDEGDDDREILSCGAN